MKTGVGSTNPAPLSLCKMEEPKNVIELADHCAKRSANKEVAISEAKRAIELLPISKDALSGRAIEMNLAVVYAWTNELGLAFEKLSSLTKVPNGIFYGELKRGPYWEPLRQDPRCEKLLAESALWD
jgi:hypothetical protein